MNLVLGPNVLDDVVNHAKASYPMEGCGFIAGRSGIGTRFIAMENTADSSTLYEMDPAALARVLRSVREAGEDLLAIYHSHPSGPSTPSARDIQLAYYPETAYVIVSMERAESPVVRAFRIIEGQVMEIEVHAIV